MAIDPTNLAGTATLTFADEFNGSSLDKGKWGTGYSWGAANGSTNSGTGEIQWYINDDYAPTAGLGTYTVGNGVLDIKEAPASAATQALVNGHRFTSGMINSAESFTQTYGYFEMRADIPSGPGMWPAFWLLPERGAWPPELDVMEVVTSSPDTLITTLHSGSGDSGMTQGHTNLSGLSSGGMHTYGVDWQPDTVTWYLDGREVFQAATPADMHQPMYMLANLAAGGPWAGQPDGSTNHMLIDYIRAYSEKPAGGGSAGNGATPPATVPDPAPTAPATGGEATPVPAPGPYVDLPWTADPVATLTGGSDGDYLRGGDAADLLVGGTGADTMRGGAGDDTYMVTQAGDDVREGWASGTDLVRTTLAEYTLPKNVENLQLNGSGPQTGIGNDGDNYLLASPDNAARLIGGDGDDTLVTKSGQATLTGGSGTDTFRFDEVPATAARVTDFEVGRDLLDVRNLLLGTGYHGSDPLADGVVALSRTAEGDTLLSFDADGSGGAAAQRIATLDNVLPSQIAAGSLVFA
ncbi:family 16 glycosylhydrolase [Methylobacterium oryzihabitans]|uniref:Glycosyl hydrolase family protein n=1 Tax=Methylobacterium oryzihabitans TaxID=2499852 RepID=A0A3S2W7Y9_9HYPH|nr:family 16 glycosylhydrolase [Methylobacterium oryzihabitans]RVU15952.1 glycosyl hydrolase family protein [Methylobacterium oryzihabitans]